jgi:hypothetical protein
MLFFEQISQQQWTGEKNKLLDTVWQYVIQMLPLELSLFRSEPGLFQGYTLQNLLSLQ